MLPATATTFHGNHKISFQDYAVDCVKEAHTTEDMYLYQLLAEGHDSDFHPHMPVGGRVLGQVRCQVQLLGTF